MAIFSVAFEIGCLSHFLCTQQPHLFFSLELGMWGKHQGSHQALFPEGKRRAAFISKSAGSSLASAQPRVGPEYFVWMQGKRGPIDGYIREWMNGWMDG
jgi:hypothetical protein